MEKVALFFGGLGEEADVSLMSAKNIVKHFDYKRHQLILIYWQKADRRFYRIKDINDLQTSSRNEVNLNDFSKLFDRALLMTHGRYGEDGVLQGILESQAIKYCGSHILGSALCMDKGRLKDFLNLKEIDQLTYQTLDYINMSVSEIDKLKKNIKANFKLPLYVKPANSGSSLGISKVSSYKQLNQAIRQAKVYDQRIIIEEGLENPIEIEVAILGNKKLFISRPGQLQLTHDFYSYDDKYKREEVKIIIPAKINKSQIKIINKLAIKAYRLAACRGFARIDFFISQDKIYLNEINTLPGFTDISMFPRLMIDRGFSYQKLLNKIIELAY